VRRVDVPGLPDGGVVRLSAHGLMLNLFPATVMDGGPANLWLRVHGAPAVQAILRLAYQLQQYSKPWKAQLLVRHTSTLTCIRVWPKQHAMKASTKLLTGLKHWPKLSVATLTSLLRH
jgi:hypothetical protein